MQPEIEAKWLNIDPTLFREQLRAAGAELVQPERQMTRATFDLPESSRMRGRWARVRDEGDKITMSYKQVDDRGVRGTKEINLVIDDFQKGCDFLVTLGLLQKSYQETKRESWLLDGAEVEVDTWPWVPTFVEVEAGSEDVLRAVAAKLDLDLARALHGSVEPVYQAVYDVTEDEVNAWPEIRFGTVPDWLERRRR